MPVRQIVAILIFLAVAGVIFVAIKEKRRKTKARRDKGRGRRSDQRRLNRHERKAYEQAIALHREGKSVSAAQLLESIGMMRESISVLESSGRIKEAAGTLMRMQKPNRAGVILARHKKWEDAALCFVKAGMDLEAAKCYRKANDPLTAAHYFSTAQRHEDAADCYYEAGEYSRAAAIFAKLNARPKYINALRKLLDSEGYQHEFDNHQVEIISEYLTSPENPFTADFLVAFSDSEQMAKLVLNLLENERAEEAEAAYQTSLKDCTDDLLIHVNYVKKQAPLLAKLLLNQARFEKAAVVYTRLENFLAAAECFEKAGDLDSAINYYDRAGSTDKLKELRKMRVKGQKPALASPPQPLPKAQEYNPFSLQAAADMEDGEIAGMNFEGERTEIFTNPEALSIEILQESSAENNNEDTKVVFQRLELLDELSHTEKELIWAIGVERKFNEGQDIIKLDEVPDGLIFILRGEVSIEITDKSNMIPIKTLKSTESFGESWVMADHVSAFLARAKTDCHLITVNKSDITTLMSENGEIARKLYKKYTLSLLNKLITHSNNSDNKIAS